MVTPQALAVLEMPVMRLYRIDRFRSRDSENSTLVSNSFLDCMDVSSARQFLT